MPQRLKNGVPQYWEKWILCAYLLMMGESWVATAAKIGRTQSTIANWKNDTEWWEKAKQEAERRWLFDMKDVARQAVYGQVKGGDGDLGLKILERLDEALAPPRQRQELTGKDGAPLPAETTMVVVTHDYADHFITTVCAVLAECGGLVAPPAATNGHSTPVE